MVNTTVKKNNNLQKPVRVVETMSLGWHEARVGDVLTIIGDCCGEGIYEADPSNLGPQVYVIDTAAADTDIGEDDIFVDRLFEVGDTIKRVGRNHDSMKIKEVDLEGHCYRGVDGRFTNFRLCAGQLELVEPEITGISIGDQHFEVQPDVYSVETVKAFNHMCGEGSALAQAAKALHDRMNVPSIVEVAAASERLELKVPNPDEGFKFIIPMAAMNRYGYCNLPGKLPESAKTLIPHNLPKSVKSGTDAKRIDFLRITLFWSFSDDELMHVAERTDGRGNVEQVTQDARDILTYRRKNKEPEPKDPETARALKNYPNSHE